MYNPHRSDRGNTNTTHCTIKLKLFRPPGRFPVHLALLEDFLSVSVFNKVAGDSTFTSLFLVSASILKTQFRAGHNWPTVMTTAKTRGPGGSVSGIDQWQPAS